MNMNLKKAFEAKNMEKEFIKKDLPNFRPGDTVKIHCRVVEGKKERIQVFQGIVVAKQGTQTNETVIVRKLSYGTYVERGFKIHSPNVQNIEVVRMGKVRRAKLYYLRGLQGKAAKIREKFRTGSKK